jgi:hypothetical protein
MMARHANLGKPRPGVNTSPKMVCAKCKEKRFKREFRLKSGRLVKICADCRKTPVESNRSEFERHLLAIHRLIKADFVERKTKGKEVKNLGKVTSKARDYASALTTLPDKIAAIIGKTYLVRGDDPKTMPDDEAITRIRNLLEELDERIIERNKNKRLS